MSRFGTPTSKTTYCPRVELMVEMATTASKKELAEAIKRNDFATACQTCLKDSSNITNCAKADN